jgi:N-carbamoylputrescine amidase
VANGLPVAVANRVGFESAPRGPGIRFWGTSFVAGCQGEILARADEADGVLLASVDLGRTEEVRRIWPFLRDRRVDAYQGLTRRYADQEG